MVQKADYASADVAETPTRALEVKNRGSSVAYKGRDGSKTKGAQTPGNAASHKAAAVDKTAASLVDHRKEFEKAHTRIAATA